MRDVILPLITLLISFSFSVLSLDASANRLWRWAPGQVLVQPYQCPIPSPFLCANEYTEVGVFVRGVDGGYIP